MAGPSAWRKRTNRPKLAAFSREPRSQELQIALDYLAEPAVGADGKPVDLNRATREKFQDLVWALINTKEFLFNH